MKILLITACIGHIICGITDCMLAYMKNGKFDFSDVKDNEKMKRVFEGASLKQIELSSVWFSYLRYIILGFIDPFVQEPQQTGHDPVHKNDACENSESDRVAPI